MTRYLVPLGILALVLFVGCVEKEHMDAAGQEGRSSYVSPDYKPGNAPVLAAPPIREALKKEAYKCRQYLVVNLDGTLRCATLVPGIVWQPYQTLEEEEEARTRYLRNYARRIK